MFHNIFIWRHKSRALRARSGEGDRRRVAPPRPGCFARWAEDLPLRAQGQGVRATQGDQRVTGSGDRNGMARDGRSMADSAHLMIWR